jgi:lipid-binding SYLF domain-containing protein
MHAMIRSSSRFPCARCAIVVALVLSTTAWADWSPDPADPRQVSAAEELARIREEIPRAARFFDEAYGYVMLPSVTRVGFGFGGAYGRGIVVEGDKAIGTASYWQFTSGIQAGGKNFSMIVFFRDRQALEYFKTNQLQFKGQAGLSLATWGVAGTPAYNEGVAIITRNRFGLMGEFTISGAQFRYQPPADE